MNITYNKRKSLQTIIVLFFVLVGCTATSPLIQPQINSLVIAGKYENAIKILTLNEQGYGNLNKLLYLMDRGLVYHYAGNFRESVKEFENAKRMYDQLYTISISKQAKTWIANDNYSPYHPEDFERVLINIFQALNFMQLKEFDEALVEAKDVDSKLRIINMQYPVSLRHIYNEDAFARILMGLVYESQKYSNDLNDAHISYFKALEIFDANDDVYFGVDLPLILKQNILATSQIYDPKLFVNLKERFSDVDFQAIAEKENKSEIFIIDYVGLAPIKRQELIPIVLPDGYFLKVVFPKYEKRELFNDSANQYSIKKDGNQDDANILMEKMVDVDELSVKLLEKRKAWMIGKSVVRQAGKYAAEKVIEGKVDERIDSDIASNSVKLISSIYNYATEQADLRSWQTMPSSIRIGRIILEEGFYEININQNLFKRITVKNGEKQFIVIPRNLNY